MLQNKSLMLSLQLVYTILARESISKDCCGATARIWICQALKSPGEIKLKGKLHFCIDYKVSMSKGLGQ